LAEIFATADSETRSIRILQRGEPEGKNLKRATAEIHAQRSDLNWRRVHSHERFVQLPNYPWQRQRVWCESECQRLDRLRSRTAPLLGIKLPGTCSWRADLADHRLSYLFDHMINGMVVMPVAGYIEALLSAQQFSSAAERDGWCVRDIRIECPLIIASDNPPQLDIRVSSEGDAVEVWSVRGNESGQGTRHAVARLHPLPGVERHRCEVFEYWSRLPEQVEIDWLYERLAVLSLQYGPMFRAITELRRDSRRGEVLARLELPEGVAGGVDGHIAHPILLDACFQTMVSLASSEDGAYLPTGIRSVEVHSPLPTALWCWGRLGHTDEWEIDCELRLFDGHGDIVARVRGLTCSSLTRGRVKIEEPVGDYAYPRRASSAGGHPACTLSSDKWGNRTASRSGMHSADSRRADLPSG
jgi:acyl transferase domain-containing protein